MGAAVSGVQWGRVHWQAERVVICGQGPSWADVDLEQLAQAHHDGACVVAVNGAVDTVGSVADHWFTLDASQANMARMRAKVPGVHYVAAVPAAFGTARAPCSWQRNGAPSGVTYLRRVVGEQPGRGKFEDRVWHHIVGGLSEDPEAIHTGNSAFGALGMAYHMRAQRVALLGVDGHGRMRWDGTPNGPLTHMRALFWGAVPQLMAAGVRLVTGSQSSAVDCFPRVTAERALRWVLE